MSAVVNRFKEKMEVIIREMWVDGN